MNSGGSGSWITRAKNGTCHRYEGRKVDEVEEGGVLVGEVTREGTGERGSAVRELRVAFEDLVERRPQARQLGFRDQALANEVAIPHVALDLLGCGEYFHLALGEAPHRVENPVGDVVATGHAGFVECEGHRPVSCLPHRGAAIAFHESIL